MSIVLLAEMLGKALVDHSGKHVGVQLCAAGLRPRTGSMFALLAKRSVSGSARGRFCAVAAKCVQCLEKLYTIRLKRPRLENGFTIFLPFDPNSTSISVSGMELMGGDELFNRRFVP